MKATDSQASALQSNIIDIVHDAGRIGLTAIEVAEAHNRQHGTSMSTQSASQHMLRMTRAGILFRLDAANHKTLINNTYFSTEARAIERACELKDAEANLPANPDTKASTPAVTAPEELRRMPARTAEISGIDVSPETIRTVATMRPPVMRPGAADFRACPSIIGGVTRPYTGYVGR